MSGYTRGGVQMTGYRATPGTNSSSNNPYANYTPAYPATSVVQGSGQQNAHYPGYGGQYGGGYAGQYVQRAPSTIMDDYERWYTEKSPSNRMLLSLRSGIDGEVGWALDRLCRLCNNDQFVLSEIPGLTEALFEWPDWFVNEYGNGASSNDTLAYEKQSKIALTASIFSLPPTSERRRRHALESIFILRTLALNNANISQLAAHSMTRKLIIRALTELEADSDETTEFILHSMELLQSISASFILPPIKSSASVLNPVPALDRLAGVSNNRSIILTSLATLTAILGNPANAAHTSLTSHALAASIRLLPLFQDTPLVDACLNFLYAHLSHPPMTKAFLLHPEMPNVLKLLVGLVVSEQVEQTKTIDISASRHMVPAVKVKSVNYEIVDEELERIGSLSEPERCYEWMRSMFVGNPDGELTQVEFWTGYKDLITPFQDRSPLLVASDVIKNVSIVFPQAQAMVLPGNQQRFVIRGIERRKKDVAAERYVCQWDHSECTANPFTAPEDLYQHLETHLNAVMEKDATHNCLWATCQHSATSLAALRPHIWTHMALKSDPNKNHSQLPMVTFSSATEQHLTDPTKRTPPPPPSTVISFPTPTREPPSSALTALLIIRTLFRASFASSDAAPRADADHFGFPGVVEEPEEQDGTEGDTAESEQEGERRGRHAFLGVRHLMESIRIQDPALMAWVYEMLNARITGTR